MELAFYIIQRKDRKYFFKKAPIRKFKNIHQV